MKSKFIVVGTIVLIIVGIGGCGVSSYNNMVKKDEGVQNKWAQVETQYQRRMDLIPNLVNTVKGYAEHESSTLAEVVAARAEATKVNIDPQNMTEADFARFQQAQDGLSSALGRLLVTVERYPDLKANQNFIELQAQLEGTENRIAVARRDFNEITRDYNSYIRKFPNNIFAGIFGFDRKVYFQSAENADKAPEVKF